MSTTQPEFTMSQYASKDDMIGAMRQHIAELKSRVQELGQMARDANSRRVVELESELAAMRAGGEPVLFVSALQFEALQDHDGMFGTYLPARKTLAGKFDKPLYTHQPAAQDAERKPLTDEQVSLAFRRGIGQWMTPGSAFAAGVRSAERAHGIAAQQGETK